MEGINKLQEMINNKADTRLRADIDNVFPRNGSGFDLTNTWVAIPKEIYCPNGSMRIVNVIEEIKKALFEKLKESRREKETSICMDNLSCLREFLNSKEQYNDENNYGEITR